MRPGIAARTLLAIGLMAMLCAPGSAETPPPLPLPHSNNAVAKLELGGYTRFYSFMGLTDGKTHADISRKAFEYDVTTKRWRALPDIPVAKGRLASTAVGVGGHVLLFGGYTVAADGSEVSTPEVFAFDPKAGTYSRRAPMPVPVDDSVALPFEDRYVFLVSGWHDKDNVALVQVYDSREDRWFRATNWPGKPVFGHAGGIAGNRMVIADGVAVLPGVKGSARFKLVDEAWIGEIDPKRPDQIRWKRLPSHPGGPLYRMAASGAARDGRVIFAGGSEIAYNYDGQGYDGRPAAPSARAFAFDLARNEWVELEERSAPTMDHRGLLEADGQYYTIGGMGERQTVIGDVIAFKPSDRKAARP